MDRNEAVLKLIKVARISEAYAKDLYDSFFEKPVVPQYVADWIEYCKFTNVNLGRALFISDIDFYNYESQEDCSKLKEFLGTETNQEIFARAWLDGYEVEKEKRYLVKIKASKHFFAKNGCGRMYFSKEYKSQFTRKELVDADFGWIFDCPGVEVKEVDDGND